MAHDLISIRRRIVSSVRIAAGGLLRHAGAWTRLLFSTLRSALRDDFGIAASSIAFAAFLALVPLIGLIASTYGMIASPATVSHNIARLVAILPLDAQRLVSHGLATKLGTPRGNLVTATVSIAVTLFSARRAGRSLLHGINLAYRVQRERRGLRRQLVSTLLVLGCAALVLTALVSLSVLALLQSYVPDGLPGARLVSTVILFGSLTLGAGAGLILTYRYAPACDAVPWRRALPGTIAGVVMWLVATLLFRIYVSRFASFGDTYGSLAAVVVLMLWLMVSAWVLLLGARLNAEVMRSAGIAIVERED